MMNIQVVDEQELCHRIIMRKWSTLFWYIKYFLTDSKSLSLMLIPYPKAARRYMLSVFLKIDKFKMAAW